MSGNIECWANNQTLNKKLALERVVRVLKSFGKQKKDINHAALQKTIDELPYKTTIIEQHSIQNTAGPPNETIARRMS